MAVKLSTVTVKATPTALNTAVEVKLSTVTVKATPTALNTAVDRGMTVRVRNLSTADGIDIGPATVETGKGWALAKEASDSFELDAGDVLYGVAAEGKEPTVAVLTT